MATLIRARALAMEKLNVDLPRLTFPKFREEPAGRYVAPADVYAILPHITHPTKRAFIELLYLLGIRPGQLKSTETSNVRVEKGRAVALVYRPAQVKQRVPHEVPLVGRAQEIVAELWKARQLGCRLLFHVNGKRCASSRANGGGRARRRDSSRGGRRAASCSTTCATRA
jgi:integrase